MLGWLQQIMRDEAGRMLRSEIDPRVDRICRQMRDELVRAEAINERRRSLMAEEIDITEWRADVRRHAERLTELERSRSYLDRRIDGVHVRLDALTSDTDTSECLAVERGCATCGSPATDVCRVSVRRRLRAGAWYPGYRLHVCMACGDTWTG